MHSVAHGQEYLFILKKLQKRQDFILLKINYIIILLVNEITEIKLATQTVTFKTVYLNPEYRTTYGDTMVVQQYNIEKLKLFV